mmetsp:Transcript_5753/g.11792  ORF Transcript_5753/g.11792 Transcript_5753/m.11792 type:complete len:253 (+) Transcript_5753:725-1483(+)
MASRSTRISLPTSSVLRPPPESTTSKTTRSISMTSCGTSTQSNSITMIPTPSPLALSTPTRTHTTLTQLLSLTPRPSAPTDLRPLTMASSPSSQTSLTRTSRSNVRPFTTISLKTVLPTASLLTLCSSTLVLEPSAATSATTPPLALQPRASLTPKTAASLPKTASHQQVRVRSNTSKMRPQKLLPACHPCLLALSKHPLQWQPPLLDLARVCPTLLPQAPSATRSLLCVPVAPKLQARDGLPSRTSSSARL